MSWNASGCIKEKRLFANLHISFARKKRYGKFKAIRYMHFSHLKVIGHNLVDKMVVMRCLMLALGADPGCSYGEAVQHISAAAKNDKGKK